MGVQTAVVIPTIREDCIRKFLIAWQKEFASAAVIVIEDNPTIMFDLGIPVTGHYSWNEINHDLKKNAWIIPRRTDCIRSYGIWKAYQHKPEMIVTLDDDCMPSEYKEGFIATHWRSISEPGDEGAWAETGEGIATRGTPYIQLKRERLCMINHGMWEGTPDLDGPTQLALLRHKALFSWTNRTIPIGKYFPMSAMNLAWRTEVTPLLYFLLMGEGEPFDRFGDIWAGIFAKKILDHLGYSVKSGEPMVQHSRASSVWSNLRKEVAAIEMNENLWKAVDSVVLTGVDPRECYLELSHKLPIEGEYWCRLKVAMEIWIGLFS